MKEIVYFIFTSIFISSLNAQPNFEWVKGATQPNHSNIYINASALDDDDNYYITGRINGTTDFDADTGKYTVTANQQMAFVAKYTKDSKLVFVKLFGNPKTSIQYIDVLTDTGIVLCGTFGDSADFNPGVGVFQMKTDTTAAFFVLKLSTNGIFNWAKKIEGIYDPNSIKCLFDNAGNIFVTGPFYKIVDFDPGPAIFNLNSGANSSFSNIFILKLSQSGNFVAAKSLYCNWYSNTNDFKIDANNNLYLCGLFKYTMDFDPDTGFYHINAGGNINSFILKLNANINFIWVVTVKNGQNEVNINNIEVDKMQNVYFAGSFSDSIDIDPGLINNQLYAANGNAGYIAKLDASSNFVWARQIDIPINAYIYSYSLLLDDSLNIYYEFGGNFIVKNTQGVDSFYIDTLSKKPQIILMVFDKLGNRKWSNSIENSNRVVINNKGSIWQSIRPNSLIDLDPGVDSTFLEVAGGFIIRKINPNKNFEWAFALGGANKIGVSKVSLSQNNIVTFGFLIGKPSFETDTGLYFLSPAYSYVAYLNKTDSSGKSLWAKKMRDEDAYKFNDLKYHCDNFGNTICYGKLSYTQADVDPSLNQVLIGSINGNSNCIYIFKWDENGNYLWVDTFMNNNLKINSITTNASGSIYCTGNFINKVDFDPGVGVFEITTSSNTYKTFILKLDANGKFLWVTSFGTDIESEQILVDNEHNLILAGTFNGQQDCDPGPGYGIITTFHYQTHFIAKYDSSGNFIWALKPGGSGYYTNDKNIFIAVDTQNNISCGGGFDVTDDFDPGPAFLPFTPAGKSDLYFSRYNSSGNLLWAKQLQADTLKEAINDFTVDYASNIYCTGYFSGSVDFNFGIDTNNFYSKNTSSFLFSLDSNGTLLWAHDFGYNDDYLEPINYAYEKGTSVCIDDHANIYSTGTFYSHADFDPSGAIHILNNTELGDSYFLKWNQCLTTNQILNINGCDSVLIGNTIFKSDTSFVLNLLNSFGCDSILNIKLEMNTSQIDTIKINTCDIFTYNNISYASSGIYLQNFTSSTQCDSQIVIVLTLNYSSDSTLTITQCDSAKITGVSYYNSGQYAQQLSNQDGCDSLLTIVLTILKSSDSSIYFNACDSVMYNGNTYYSTGIYPIVFTNSLGCDSTINLHINLASKSPTILFDSACTSYTLNNVQYDSTGVYTQQLTNSFGCDSIIELHIIIYPTELSVTIIGDTLHSNANNALYQWVDCNNNYTAVPWQTLQTFIPLTTGVYAVIVNNGICIDTSLCIPVVVGLSELFNQNISVTPNPTSGNFNITLSNVVDKINLKIYDMTSRMVYQNNYINTGQINEKLSAAPGSYIFKLEINNVEQIFRIVKL